MKATIFEEKGNIQVHEVSDPVIQKPDDAVVNVVRSCICGSDLWYYRGLVARPNQSRIGHEFIGIVESVGSEVHKIKVGDFVIAPFVISDGTCP
jgi:threonine dehydrogenase-like Zn-dependent dehydrogenase